MPSSSAPARARRWLRSWAARTADHLESVTEGRCACCRAPACSRCCCRARSLRWGAHITLRHVLWSTWAWRLCWLPTSNPGSSPIASMPFMLSLACLQMGLSPAEALIAATLNAAWSLDLGDRVGSLDAGKQADFLIHEFTDYRETGLLHRRSSQATGLYRRKRSDALKVVAGPSPAPHKGFIEGGGRSHCPGALSNTHRAFVMWNCSTYPAMTEAELKFKHLARNKTMQDVRRPPASPTRGE